MISEKIEGLMWQEIDGSISAKDHAQLNEFLEEHPEARGHYEGLVAFASLLDRVGKIEPPPELRGGVARAVDPARYAAHRVPAGPSGARRFRPFGWNPRVALGMAAGFVLGIIGYQIVNYGPGFNRPLDNSKLRGTMKLPQLGRGTSDVKFDVDPAAGSIVFSRDGDEFTAEIDVTSQRESKWSSVTTGSSCGSAYWMPPITRSALRWRITRLR